MSTWRPGRTLWRPGPTTFAGRHYAFSDVHLEPKPWRADGPRLWFGGSTVGPWIIRRLVAYGHGLHPFGQPTADELRPLAAALTAAGRDISELEIVGGIRGRFGSADGGRGSRRGGRGDPGAARRRLHDDLLQAVAVHRRPRARWARCAGAWWRSARRLNDDVRSHTVLTSQ